MKKYFSLLLALCMGLTCLPGCTGDSDNKFSDKNKTYKVLFIGNSFTDYNNLARDIFVPLCEKAGYNVTVDTVTRGAYILELFADSADQYGAKVDECLKNNKYDAVILQEQSHRPISDNASFRRGVQRLAEKVKENGAQLFLYETWGYKGGHGSLPAFGGNTQEMAKKLSDAYLEAGKEVNAKIIHAGIAMLDVYLNHKQEIELYQPDLYHPSYDGSVLVGYTMLATMFDVDIRDIEFDIGSRWKNDILIQAAYDAAIVQKYN